MVRPKLTLYFDLHSPYSYLAFHVIKNSPIFRFCEVTYTPALLVAFIKLVGLQPPWNNPNKSNYITADITRWSQEFRIPWTPGWPAKYPFGATTLQIQRVLTACTIESPESPNLSPNLLPDLIGALYHAFWFEKKSVQLPEVHEPIIVDVLGEAIARRVIEKSSSDEVKELLKQNTQEAVSSGAPGVPWIKATDTNGQVEYFWGFDHLGQVARFLGLGRVNLGSHL